MAAILKRAWFVDQSPGRGVYDLTGGGGGSSTTPGNFYVEFAVGALPTSLEYSALFGICGSTFTLSNPIQLDNASAQGADGALYWVSVMSGTPVVSGQGSPAKPEGTGNTTHTAGDVYGLAFSTISNLMWMRRATVAPTLWYGVSGAGTSSPETGIEGFDFSSQVSGNVYLLGGASQPGNADVHHPTVTLNAGASAFVATPPTGYSAFNSDTTWNSLDKDTEIVLSNGDLTLTCTAITGSNQPTTFVRSTLYRTR